jgi:hypothetical protein
MQDVAIVGGAPLGSMPPRAGVRFLHRWSKSIRRRRSVHCTGVLAAEAFPEFGLPRRALLNS